VSLSGEIIAADAADLCIRMLSNGQPHRALPGTGSVCAAVAARIPGTIPHRLAQAGQSATHPPGARAVDARGAGNDGDSNGNGSGDGDGSGNGGPATRGANEPVRLAMPSGVIAVDAEVVWREAGWHAVRGSVFRTARRLFKGELYY
jgi:2-methylaconitate cis-trans-isomerase PrpF